MRHLKKYNEDMSAPNEVFITKINSDNPYEYSEPRLSIYIEDGQLRPAKFIICHDLDMEGRYRTGVLGIYKIKPEHFNIKVNKTFDGKKTWNSYSLNQSGVDYLKSCGKWSTTFDLVDEEYIQNLISKNEKSIEGLQRGIDRYKTLLSQ